MTSSCAGSHTGEAPLHCEIAAEAFGAPVEVIAGLVTPSSSLARAELRGYVGEVDGEPVVTAIGIVAGGAVGIFNVATYALASTPRIRRRRDRPGLRRRHRGRGILGLAAVQRDRLRRIPAPRVRDAGVVGLLGHTTVSEARSSTIASASAQLVVAVGGAHRDHRGARGLAGPDPVGCVLEDQATTRAPPPRAGLRSESRPDPACRARARQRRPARRNRQAGRSQPGGGQRGRAGGDDRQRPRAGQHRGRAGQGPDALGVG